MKTLVLESNINWSVLSRWVTLWISDKELGDVIWCLYSDFAKSRRQQWSIFIVFHNNKVTGSSRGLKSLATRQFVQQLVQPIKSKLRITGFYEWNPLVIGVFSSQKTVTSKKYSRNDVVTTISLTLGLFLGSTLSCAKFQIDMGIICGFYILR